MKPNSKKFLASDGRKFGKFPRNVKKANLVDEDGPVPLPSGMKKPHRVYGKYDQKYSSVDYSLLRRILKGNKGRKWDDVYSELCAAVDGRTFEGKELRGFIDHYVRQNVTIHKDGSVVDNTGHEVGSFWSQFYIHPETGNLEYVSVKRWRARKSDKKIFEVDGKQYHKHDGLWYRVTMVEFEIPRYYDSRYSGLVFNDAFVGHSANYGYFTYCDTLLKLEFNYGKSENGKLQYCKEKQSANKEEIKRLKKKHKL